MAKSKWPKLPSYKIPLFHCAWIYLAQSKEEWLQAEAALGIAPADPSFNSGMCRHYFNDKTGENLYLVGVFNGSPATLVHECAHATFYTCYDAGVTVKTNEANETYCYMLDRMFAYFLPHITEGKK